MKISIKREDVYTLTIGDSRFPGMRKVSEWNGFIEFEGLAGVAILANDGGPISNAFDQIFDLDRGDWRLIMGSPNIVAAQKE